MPKGKFISDTIEKVGEIASPTKQTEKAVKSLLNPTGFFHQIIGIDNQEQAPSKIDQKPGQTPLDIANLQKKYKEQDDKQKMASLRQRLFQLAKSNEEKAITDTKRKEQEKQQLELREAQEKKRQEEERKRQEQMDVAPQGKVRKSIFSKKKVVQRQQLEVKPGSSKQ